MGVEGKKLRNRKSDFDPDFDFHKNRNPRFHNRNEQENLKSKDRNIFWKNRNLLNNRECLYINYAKSLYTFS